MRVEPSLLQLPASRRTWAPDGLVAYSKVCTHAGCPVGLYEADIHELLCPCHQSSFDVLDGAGRSAARPRGRSRSCRSRSTTTGCCAPRATSASRWDPAGGAVTSAAASVDHAALSPRRS